MKTALLCVLCIGVVLGQPQSHENCTLVSRDTEGNPAFCGGVEEAECPNTSDTCTKPQGANIGPCCLGCQHGNPLPDFLCGGWLHPNCESGYQCVFDPFIADAPGMCCPIGTGQGNRRRRK